MRWYTRFGLNEVACRICPNQVQNQNIGSAVDAVDVNEGDKFIISVNIVINNANL